MAKRGFKRRSCIDCWQRKVACDIGLRRRDGYSSCSACSRRRRACRMNVNGCNSAEAGSSLSKEEHAGTLIGSDSGLSLLSPFSLFADDANPIVMHTPLSGSPWYDAVAAPIPEFFCQPWLVSHLLATHANEISTGTMPLLHLGATTCFLIKSGCANTDRAQLLADARLCLERATVSRTSSDYDILASMVALSEVWNLAELIYAETNNLIVDVRSLQAMCKLTESCVSNRTHDKVNVENMYVYWVVYVYDAFEAIDMERLPFVQEQVVDAVRHRFALRKQTPQEEWFSQLCSLATIARAIACASWTAKTVSSSMTLDVRRRLFKMLQDWQLARPYSKARDDFLSLLHMACFVYLHVILSKFPIDEDLEAIMLHRDVESGALQAILSVFKLMTKARCEPRPSLLDQSRTAVHLVMTFAYWALEHVESHITVRQRSELDGFANGANSLLDAVAHLFDLDTDAAIQTRYLAARQLSLHVQSLLHLLTTLNGSLAVICP